MPTAPITAASSRADAWIAAANVLVAAAAMSLTLPGRTHGLGVITTPLLQDLGLAETAYAALNFWAILLGTLLFLPVGLLIDRVGVRAVSAGVAAALGATVLGMSRAEGPNSLFLFLTLTRGLGQTALSVASMAIMGKRFTRDSGRAMSVYAVLVSVGSIIAFEALLGSVRAWGWRAAWGAQGWTLLFGLAPLCWLAVRTPKTPVPAPQAADAGGSPQDSTLWQALRSPAFWTFALATSFFNLIWSAITLLQRELLTERGFDPKGDAYEQTMTALMVCGMASNLLSGWLAHRGVGLGRLLAAGMALFGLSLVGFPLIDGVGQAMLYGAALGLASGPIIVVFFACWGQFFGKTHLGKVQGAAQVLTVFASASGPWLLAGTKTATGGYGAFFPLAGGVAAVLGLAVLLTPTTLAAERQAK